MSSPTSDLLTALLRDVSRSFYLSLRLLPGAVRSQIGLAYLLARTTDTIADTEVLPAGVRLEALRGLRDRILGNRAEALDFGPLAEHQASPAEARLLMRVEEAIRVLGGLACFDRCCVRAVVETIVGGQELDLRRFGGSGSGRIVALETEAELDDYTFRVAGCVGEFWTRVCRSHLYPAAPIDMGEYLADAIRFGKGLQLVNILRDLPVDLRMGRCYLPARELAEAGLQPGDLLELDRMERFRPVYRRWVGVAAGHLQAGWRYTCATPRSVVRVRVACALPLLIGAETLRMVAAGNVLDGRQRIKIARARVRSLLWRSLCLYPFSRRWEGLFDLGELTPASTPAS